MYCDIGKHLMVIGDIELLRHGDISEQWHYRHCV